MPFLGSQPAEVALTTGDLGDDIVTLGKLASGTDGELITWDSSGNPAAVAVGTATHVLTSNGAGAAPTFQAAGGGKLISRKYSSYATYTSTTSVIPMDDTIPQITEGVQIMTVTTDTLASSSNRLRIAYGGMFNSSTTGSRPSLAIFDGASNAIHAIMKAVTANNTYGFFFHGEYEYAPGATTAKTITCRAGTDNASYTLYFNGSNGARYLGGAQSFYLIVDELEP